MGFLQRPGVPSLMPSRFGLDLLSTGEGREPLGLGIACGVDIPVMHRTALGTGNNIRHERMRT